MFNFQVCRSSCPEPQCGGQAPPVNNVGESCQLDFPHCINVADRNPLLMSIVSARARYEEYYIVLEPTVTSPHHHGISNRKGNLGLSYLYWEPAVWGTMALLGAPMSLDLVFPHCVVFPTVSCFTQ